MLTQLSICGPTWGAHMAPACSLVGSLPGLNASQHVDSGMNLSHEERFLLCCRCLWPGRCLMLHTSDLIAHLERTWDTCPLPSSIIASMKCHLCKVAMHSCLTKYWCSCAAVLCDQAGVRCAHAGNARRPRSALRQLPTGPAALESAVSTCRVSWRMQLSFAAVSLPRSTCRSTGRRQMVKPPLEAYRVSPAQHRPDL